MVRETRSTKGLERFKQERDALQLYLQMREQDASPESQLTTTLIEAMLETSRRIIVSAEEGKPFIATSYGNAPEVLVALELPWYPLLLMPYLPTRAPFILEEIDEAVRFGLGTDMCTLIRLGISSVQAGHAPLPTAFVGLLSPCDGASMFHQAIARDKYWRNVPIFCTELPYWENDLSVDFHANELRRMVAFLEKHTGRNLDIDRLREVVKESNKQYELWAKYNELRRTVPCPPAATKGAQAWNVAQNFLVGDPRGTEWFRKLVTITEQQVKEGKGNEPKEKIRLLWFDVPALWLSELTKWLKEEWGARIVMDMMGYSPHTLIDASSEESMFRGLAKRNLCDLPMVRQVHGTADTLANDIVQVVRDYRINCVVWPAHMGHKDGSASIGIMRQICREIGVPFLALGLDLFDKRYTSIEQLKNRFSEFFTTMGLGQDKEQELTAKIKSKPSEALQEFTEAAETLANPEIENWRRQGGKVVGYFCSAVPGEIITAAGLVPFRIRATGSRGTELSDAYFSNINCGFPRHCFNMALLGKYDFLDGVICVSSCDHIRRVYDNWKRYVKRPAFLEMLGLPRKSGGPQVEWYQGEIENLKKRVENHFGVKITDERLWEAIKLHNETRRLQRKLYELRKRENPPITGAETLAIMVAGTAMPRKRYNELLKGLLDEVSQYKSNADYRAKLMITGGILDDPTFVRVVEDVGGLVVADSLCFGSRSMWNDVSEGKGDPMSALACYYIVDRPSCPRMFGEQAKRSNFIMDMIREFRVDGVIGERLMFCDQWLVEHFMQGEDFKEAGIPFLELDREYILSGVGQLRTRVQAFLETMGK